MIHIEHSNVFVLGLGVELVVEAEGYTEAAEDAYIVVGEVHIVVEAS